MSSVVDKIKLEAGDYSALFVPSKGMNFISLKKGEIEALDQSTLPLFEERCAGLGAMIGPHFHHRKVIPSVPHEECFPHIAAIKAKGGKEPFSHGIGRYAPWTVEETSEIHIRALLRGIDTWNGVQLKDLEGQDFTILYEAKLTSDGLQIELSVKSATESVVGLHTYYALAGGKGKVTARVRDHYRDEGVLKPIPSSWNYRTDHTLVYPLTQPTDFGFQPYPDPLHGVVKMETETHTIQVQYWSNNEENSFQLWHPEGASFACIEPLSAQDPRKPRLTVNQLKILISVL